MNFKIQDTEKAVKWLNEHQCKFCDPENIGAIGGRLTYAFTPTGLGIICKIICACGEEIDCTDYEGW
jgi:hypothetical protein